MAAFRRDLQKLMSIKSIEEEEDHSFDQENASLYSEAEENPSSERHTDSENEEVDMGLSEICDIDDESDDLNTRKPMAAANRKRQRVGRKAVWPENCINELVDVVCENEYYQKKLIFTNNKATKNLEVYIKIVKEVKARLAERGEVFLFSVVQTRTKFKACIAACKKASMTRKCGSGIANFMEQQPPWFKKLYPFVESRDSCNPDMALEPTFAGENCVDDSEKSSCSDQSTTSAESTKKDLFVPMPSKRPKRESANSILKEAVSAFNNFASKDPTESFIEFMRVENERSRKHEKEMVEMQMRMMQAILVASPNYQQQPPWPGAHYNQQQIDQQQRPAFFSHQPQNFESWTSFMNANNESNQDF